MTSHVEAKCPEHIIECQYCKLKRKHRIIAEEHIQRYPKRPLPCPKSGKIYLNIGRCVNMIIFSVKINVAKKCNDIYLIMLKLSAGVAKFPTSIATVHSNIGI